MLSSGTFGISSSALQQFYYTNVKKSWLEAQSYCRATYIDLATVGSMEDMNRLKAAVDPAYTGAVWIGLKKHWVLSTGENISAYNNWVPGQPNEGNVEAACGVYSSQGWNDSYCSSMSYFVCFDGNLIHLLLVTYSFFRINVPDLSFHTCCNIELLVGGYDWADWV